MEIRVLTPGDAAVLDHVADEVFDNPIDPRSTAEFLADPRHHICVAVEDGVVVGFASAVRYIHPDKQPELWINEVAVAPPLHRRGVGKAIMARLLVLARELGCVEAWVLTDEDNAPARALYRSAGGEETPAGVMVTFKLEK